MTRVTDPVVEFGELPPETRGAPRSDANRLIANALKARPGEWAKIATKATKSGAGAMTHQWRTGGCAASQPAGAFEAKSRGLDVWARYVGGAS